MTPPLNQTSNHSLDWQFQVDLEKQHKFPENITTTLPKHDANSLQNKWYCWNLLSSERRKIKDSN